MKCIKIFLGMIVILSGAVLSWSQSPMPSCRERATGPIQDPQDVRRDFATLGRCKNVTRWQRPPAPPDDPNPNREIKDIAADVCIGQYTDPRDHKRVYMVWGRVEGRFDERSGITAPSASMAVAEGKLEYKGKDGETISESAEEASTEIVLHKTVDYPSANGDPNKAHNDRDVLLRFSKQELSLSYDFRSRGNYPVSWPGQPWEEPTRVALTCVQE